MKFGAWLRERRLDKGLTMVQFARMCGLSYVTISNLERGKTRAGIYAMRKIANALDIEYLDVREKQKQGEVEHGTQGSE